MSQFYVKDKNNTEYLGIYSEDGISDIKEQITKWQEDYNIQEYKIELSDDYGHLVGDTNYSLEEVVFIGEMINENGEAFSEYIKETNIVPDGDTFERQYLGRYRTVGDWANEYYSDYVENLPYEIQSNINWEDVGKMIQSITVVNNNDNIYIYNLNL
jgi:hypothetical protein